jgi:hypothetical protein
MTSRQSGYKGFNGECLKAGKYRHEGLRAEQLELLNTEDYQYPSFFG